MKVITAFSISKLGDSKLNIRCE